MFDNLSSKLDRAFKTLKGQGSITEINVAQTIKEVRRALVDADVNYKVAKTVTDKIKDEAMGRDVLIAVSPGQLMVKIVHEELTELMGGEKQDINIKGEPAVILIAGLQGSGKTTFTGKLANYLKKQNRQVMVAACDVYRPAAIDQLKVLAGQVGVDVYSNLEEKNPVKIAQEAIAFAKQNHKKIVIIDTAGRLAVDEEPIKVISTGEKMEALDLFYPDRMAQRILGMGDVISLVERAQQSFDEDEAKKLNQKIRKNQFSFDDFLSQIQQIKKMGSIKDLVGMIPGM